MAGAHAKRSPSGSPAWTLCSAKLNREAGIPDDGDKTAANRGTICHDLSAKALDDGNDHMIDIAAQGFEANVEEDTGNVIYLRKGAGGTYEVDDDIIDSARRYVAFVRDLARGGELHIEQRLSIEHITGEKGAKGTTDCGIIFPREGCITDLKSGREPVYAKYLIDESIAAITGKPVGSWMPNPQLVIYGDAFRLAYDHFDEWERMRLIICQPPLDHVDEYVLEIEEFEWWVQWIRERAALTLNLNAPATPGEKQCKYCRYAPRCPELADTVMRTALEDFATIGEDDIVEGLRPRTIETSELPVIYGMLDMIEDWCKTMRGRMYLELASGTLGAGCGWKLVQGRKGNRYFENEQAAEALMREVGMTDDQRYTKKLIGPAKVEDALGKKSDAWAKFKPLIRQDDGKFTVAPEFDERPAVQSTASAVDDFNDETAIGGASAGDDAGGLAEFFD